MTSPVQNSLPFAPAGEHKASPDPAADDRRGRQLAWHREMERAATDSWFQYAVAQHRSLAVTPLQPQPAARPVAVKAESAAALQRSTASDPRSEAARTDPEPKRSPQDRAVGSDAAHEAVETHVASRPLPAQPTPIAADAPVAESSTRAEPHRQSLPAIASPEASKIPRTAPSISPSEVAQTDPPLQTTAAPPRPPIAVRPPAAPVGRLESRTDELTASQADDMPVRLRNTVRSALSWEAPVRLHIQHDADGASIWMGVDRSVTEQIPQLVKRLSRWMTRNGFRLRCVVCNGSPLHLPVRDTASLHAFVDVDVFVERNN